MGNKRSGRRSQAPEIELSAEERNALERLAHHSRTAPYREVVRARAILMAADGARISEIARVVDMSERAVGNWRRAFVQRRLGMLRDERRCGRPRSFKPAVRAAAVHLACQKPGSEGEVECRAREQPTGALSEPQDGTESGAVAVPQRRRMQLPLSRFSAESVAHVLVQVGLVTSISVRTVERWLKADKIKPWLFRSWITPKDVKTFLQQACPILDLYERVAEGALAVGEWGFSLDEKTSIQARRHATYRASGAGEPAHLEHTYKRCGAVQLLAALNVVTGVVFGRVVEQRNFAEFTELLHTLLNQAMSEGAQIVHLILDNGSIHRPKYLGQWLAEHYPNLRVELHWTPVRSSWLNQIEIFFSVLQRKALSPNNFRDTDELKQRIADFIDYRNEQPKPIRWTYTSDKLRKKWADREPQCDQPAAKAA